MSVGAIIDILVERLGLDPDSHGEGAIERAVRGAMERAGFTDPAAYREHLRRDAVALDALTDAVLVPETWFFRYPSSYELLAAHAREHRADTAFRMLCIPCSTGEEPYSAAMTLLDDGMVAGRVRIVAIDVSARCLEHARAGRYGPKAFRGHASDLLERYGAWEGGEFIVGDEARAVIEWHHGNVLDESCVGVGAPYAAIFCRNLLIYLGAREREAALAVLRRCLAPTGRLFVGHGETSIAARSGFHATDAPAAFATRPVEHRAASRPATRPTPPRRRPAANTAHRSAVPRTATPRTATPDTRRAARGPRGTPPAPAPAAADGLDEVQSLADAGRLDRARALCEAHLVEHGASARAHYLLGVVQASLREDEAARHHLERAVYLDPDHHEALVHLALQAQSRGDHDEVAAWRRRARRALERRGEES